MGFPLHTYSPEKCLWPHLSQLHSALSFAPMRSPYLAKYEMYQWDRAIVPQYHIWVQIFMSRIQAFPLWREVCSQVPHHLAQGLALWQTGSTKTWAPTVCAADFLLAPRHHCHLSPSLSICHPTNLMPTPRSRHLRGGAPTEDTTHQS